MIVQLPIKRGVARGCLAQGHVQVSLGEHAALITIVQVRGIQRDRLLATDDAFDLVVQPIEGQLQVGVGQQAAATVVELTAREVQLRNTGDFPGTVVQGIDGKVHGLARIEQAALPVIQGTGVDLQHADRSDAACAVINAGAVEQQVRLAGKPPLGQVIEAAGAQLQVVGCGDQAGLIEQMPGNAGRQRAIAGEFAVGVIDAGRAERERVASRKCTASVADGAVGAERQPMIPLNYTLAVVQ
ncbi:hypothetical protein PSWA111526_20055 [Pseudomonas wadenswilerensis]|uniref:Uncharacterized protein n=1 Tax=Pseudomonas wadenswilerensis TaxID=1785161 RepID=A0A380SWF2_9PSED|nr:hypothetical protein [Pseudomonas wadenswilerensis]SUQ62332.1 hypothetical protein CCOS864_01775 [Pseudomonas wadenswilerensis]